MFRASMSLKNSHVFSKIIIFDDQKSELCVIVVYFMYVCMINLYMQDKLHYTVFFNINYNLMCSGRDRLH